MAKIARLNFRLMVLETREGDGDNQDLGDCCWSSRTCPMQLGADGTLGLGYPRYKAKQSALDRSRAGRQV
jgi:hypothetical protein